MGCGCYESKKDDKLIKKKVSKNILDSSDKNTIKSNINQDNEQANKLSSISSFLSENSNKNKTKDGKKKFQDNQKKFRKYKSVNLVNKPNLKQQVVCYISIINFNDKEKKKFSIKINKSGTIQDLVNLVQTEINKLYHINEHAIIFYNGIKVNEDELLIDLIKKQNEIINLNLTDGNNNIEKEQNEISEINFEVILIPFEDEEIINKVKSSNDQKEITQNKNWKEYYIQKKVVTFLFPKCNTHKEESLIYICLTCYNSFCAKDFEEHKSQFQEHNIIDKNKLIDLNFEVKNIKQNLFNKYNELVLYMNIEKDIQNSFPDKNQINYISTNDLFKKIKIEINNMSEKMEILFNSIKETYQKVNLKFLSIYEEKMPQIVEFSEYMDKILSSAENLNIFSNENMFIENYDNCLNVKKISDKYYNNIVSLKEIIIKYKEFLESFKDKGNNLIDYIKQGIDNIFKIKNVEKIFSSSTTELYQPNPNDYNLYKSTYINNKMTKKNINDISMNTTRDLNQSINLKFLFSDKKSRKFDIFKRDNTFNLLSRGLSSSYIQKNIGSKDKNKNGFLGKEKLISLNLDNKKFQNIAEEIIPKNRYNLGSSNLSLNSDSNKEIKCSSNLSSMKESIINIYSLIYG